MTYRIKTKRILIMIRIEIDNELRNRPNSGHRFKNNKK